MRETRASKEAVAQTARRHDGLDHAEEIARDAIEHYQRVKRSPSDIIGIVFGYTFVIAFTIFALLLIIAGIRWAWGAIF